MSVWTVSFGAIMWAPGHPHSAQTSTLSHLLCLQNACRFDLYAGGNKAGMAVLTGIVAADPTKTATTNVAGDYVLNAQMTTMVSFLPMLLSC
jgi:hypothetical protein